MDAILGRLSEPTALDDQVEEVSAGMDLWLNQDFDDDDIGRSILEFTVPEFVGGSPDDTFNNIQTTNRLQCMPNDATCCGDGPANSGALYGKSDYVQPPRFGALRSYSTNDLELLLETSMSVFPPLIGGSATVPQGAHVKAASGKTARSGHALEPVPEGAPSQGGPLPGLSVVDTCSLKFTNAASPGPNRALDVKTPAPTAGQSPFLPTLSVPSARTGAADGDATMLSAQASINGITSVSPPQLLSSLPPVSSTSSGNLRHIPSFGTLSVLMDHTLHLSPEGANDSQQQLPPTAAGEPRTSYQPASAPGMSLDQQLEAQSETHRPHLHPQLQDQHLASSGNPVVNTPVPGAEVASNSIPGWGAAAVAVSECTTMQVTSSSNVGAASSDTHGAGGRLRKVQSALELGAWRNAAFSEEQDGPQVSVPGAPFTVQKMIGRLTPEERMQRILRYRQKRNTRNFNREIKYQCRKTLADSRPRVCGRFARNDDPKSVLPHQTKKAQRTKTASDIQPIGIKTEPSAGGQLAVTGSPDGLQLESGFTQQTAAWQLLSRSASVQAALSALVVQLPAATGNNSTTTSSGISEGSGPLAAGTAAAAMSNASLGINTLPCSAGQPLLSSIPMAAPTGNLPSCGMPSLPVGTVFPYVLPSLTHLPVSVPVPLPAGLPMLSMAAWDPTQLQQHYHMVHAAAQAAAHGVYAHLGITHAAGPHAPATGPILSPYSATQQPQPHVLANPPTILSVGHSLDGSMPVNAGSGPVSAPSEVPPRVDTPLLDSVFALMDAELDGTMSHTGQARPMSGSVGTQQSNSMNVTCMTVDS